MIITPPSANSQTLSVNITAHTTLDEKSAAQAAAAAAGLTLSAFARLAINRAVQGT